jgi:hypothetical protein
MLTRVCILGLTKIRTFTPLTHVCFSDKLSDKGKGD